MNTTFPHVKRDDLSWALDAVLPHAGKARGKVPGKAPYIGMEVRSDRISEWEHTNRLYLYATDGHTIGIARITMSESSTWAPFYLPTNGEAESLQKWIRPHRKAEEEHQVFLVVDQLSEEEPLAALHVGIREGDLRESNDLLDNSAFILTEGKIDLKALMDLMHLYEAQAIEPDEYTFDPDLLDRFTGHAGRIKGDRLRMRPNHITKDEEGITYTTIAVGTDFHGAILGLTQREGLNAVLEGWFPE